jgi:hypothetical protein
MLLQVEAVTRLIMSIEVDVVAPAFRLEVLQLEVAEVDEPHRLTMQDVTICLPGIHFTLLQSLMLAERFIDFFKAAPLAHTLMMPDTGSTRMLVLRRQLRY